MSAPTCSCEGTGTTDDRGPEVRSRLGRSEEGWVQWPERSTSGVTRNEGKGSVGRGVVRVPDHKDPVGSNVQKRVNGGSYKNLKSLGYTFKNRIFISDPSICYKSFIDKKTHKDPGVSQRPFDRENDSDL